MKQDNAGDDRSERNWLDKLVQRLTPEPRDREQLLELLQVAGEKHLIDADTLGIFEGALRVSDMQVREIMVPRAQMVCVRTGDSLQEVLATVIRSAHSRFPAIGESKDDIKGILLAKDLLPLLLDGKDSQFDLNSLIRPVQVVPESKRLQVLLREFREKRSHIVIVIDEYGGAAGLATIEDVLEEIVGDIEDEYDREDKFVRHIRDHEYGVKALMPIEEFNEQFGTQLPEDEYDTIGGLVTNSFGYLPQPGEEVVIEGVQFAGTKADSLRLLWLRMILPAGRG